MGSFVERKVRSNSFNEVIDALSNNSTNFEKISILEKYTNTGLKYMESTKLGLVYFRNIIFDKYIERIIIKRKKMKINSNEKEIFNMNPYVASYKLLGSVDYWWLLLIANKKKSINDFVDFDDFVYIPDMADIKEILKIELYHSDKLGIEEN